MASTEAEVRPTEALAVIKPEPPSTVMLLQTAIQQGASVEALEKLVDLHERLKANEAKAAYFVALTDFQAECPVVPKRKTAGQGSFTYRYAPLEDIVKAVSPLLRKHGLSYRFDTQFFADPPAQLVTCTVYHVQGHSESSEFRTPVDTGARMNDMQKSASAQTYAKRYAFCNALGILTGDDDDDGASGGHSRPQPVATPSSSVADQQWATSAPAFVPPSPRPVGKNLVPLKRTPRDEAEPDPLAAQRQEMVERAVALELLERKSNELEPLAEDVALVRARKRCDQFLDRLYGKTLATATKSELEGIGRIIEKNTAKVEAAAVAQAVATQYRAPE